jgi:hypothetical protein
LIGIALLLLGIVVGGIFVGWVVRTVFAGIAKVTGKGKRGGKRRGRR